MTNRNLSLTRPVTLKRTIVSNGNVTASGTTFTSANSLIETFFASSRPGNRVSPTPYSFSKVSRTVFPGYSHRREYFNGDSYDDLEETGPIYLECTPASVDSWLNDTAYNNALSSLNDQLRGSIDLSIDLAQAGDTTKMVRDALKLVRSFRAMPQDLMKRAARAYARSGPKGVTRAIGSKWLEYQYGWRPLMQSVYDTAYQVIQSPERLLVIRGRGNATSTKKKSLSARNLPYDSVATMSSRAEIKCHFLPPSFAQTLSGFTSLNPLTLAWEVIPYSFVVDWFVDIGGYMRNMETACINASAFQSGYLTVTRKCESVAEVNGQSKVGSDPRGYWFVQAKTAERQVFLDRSLLLQFPLPRIPRFSMDLGSGRLLNAAALLSQHLRR